MSLTPQQKNKLLQALASSGLIDYSVGPPHTYYKPWPPNSSNLTLGGIQAGTLVPINPGGGIVPLQPIALPTSESPPSGMLPFNFAPGLQGGVYEATGVQVQTSSYPAKECVFFAPTSNALNIYVGQQGTAFGSKGFPIPPGGAGTIHVADVVLLYWAAGNLTDVITGWFSSRL